VRRPVSELLGVNVFEAVLKLRSAHAVFHGQILTGWRREKRRPLGKFGLQAADDVRSAAIALRQRHEIDLERPLLSVVFVPSIPMKEERLCTAGSFRITAAVPVAAAPSRQTKYLRSFGNARMTPVS